MASDCPTVLPKEAGKFVSEQIIREKMENKNYSYPRQTLLKEGAMHC